MDMQKYNDSIKNAEDEVKDDGPRFPDGDYVFVVREHEEKNKFPIAGTDPIDYDQIGLWVTFLICEGEYRGKEHMEYINVKHPTSKICNRYGLSTLKRLYRAIGFLPKYFQGTYGKRFIGTLESTEQDDKDYPWSTKIVAFKKAPEEEVEKFEEAVPAPNHTIALDGGQRLNTRQEVEPVTATEKWNAKEEIDEIPF